MATRYDICTGRKDSTGKTYWTKIGAMFPSREGDGFAIKLDALPIANEKGEVWISAFVPKPRENDGQSPRQDSPSAPSGGGRPGGYKDIDDDIPFSAEFR